MKKKSRIIILAIIVLLLITHFIFKASRSGGQPLLFDRLVVYTYRPVISLFNRVTRFAADSAEKYFFLVRTQEENRVLRDNLELLRLQNHSLWRLLAEKHEQENTQLYYGKLKYELKRVAVLGHDPFAQSQILWIDAGAKQGVGIDTVVVSGKGLVGRVIEVFDTTSKVLMLIDSYFAVDVYNERTGVRCLVKGMRSGDLEMHRYPYLSQIEYTEKIQEFKAGDLLSTSGVGEIYPAGVPVGQVVKLEVPLPGYVGRAKVLPLVDFSKLRDVYVLLKKRDL